jgi:hypothetical protein
MADMALDCTQYMREENERTTLKQSKRTRDVGISFGPNVSFFQREENIILISIYLLQKQTSFVDRNLVSFEITVVDNHPNHFLRPRCPFY